MGRRFGFACVFIGILLVCPIFAQDELAAGKILVADKDLKDPNFDQTVVLLITYDEQGAVGLILNRESDTPVTQVLKGIKEAAARKDFAFSGGPVENDSILALYRTTSRKQGVHQISRDVSAVLDEGALKEALASGASDDVLRFFIGYAGWGPRQLDAEVEAGAWTILSGEAKTVFDSEPDTLWNRLNRRKDEHVVENQSQNLAQIAE